MVLIQKGQTKLNIAKQSVIFLNDFNIESLNQLYYFKIGGSILEQLLTGKKMNKFQYFKIDTCNKYFESFQIDRKNELTLIFKKRLKQYFRIVQSRKKQWINFNISKKLSVINTFELFKIKKMSPLLYFKLEKCIFLNSQKQKKTKNQLYYSNRMQYF
ncbi:hypothetical protein TTHERM_000994420 (macronuclear) [Tetrahymena thermophila SB210]|uniref:Uncharacterized protein n=1 Tax=Tetrahymena thermophila (strain SB210) TaxID=312017 RepID=W7X6G2_TETTS|nr:hypothetical protein TTHERM_000994420 [Tetrahymena thermophila SB210]EWS71943.1 hypothetical protein TTHERM_000994420 [Tetrahymena thermophila SB210]|eukprot:XP_012655529.1 hypothetical protein TTHERM_000994420 [Tetrahymena thermophila SB210]